MDRRLLRRRPDTRTRLNETQSDKTVGHWTDTHSDRVLGHWSTPADHHVDDVDQSTEHDSRQRHTLPDARHLAVGAGDSDPAQSKLSRQQTGHVDHRLRQMDHPHVALSSVPRGLSIHSDTVSEPAAIESARYRRHFDDSVEEDVSSGQTKSDITDLRHTRRSTALTKTDRRAESTTRSRQQRSNKASRLTEQHGADVMPQDEQDSRQDVGRRRHTATTSERSADAGHDQRRQPAMHQQHKVPRRLVFRFVSIVLLSRVHLAYSVSQSCYCFTGSLETTTTASRLTEQHGADVMSQDEQTVTRSHYRCFPR